MTDDKDARIAALEMELEAAKRDAEDCDLFLVCVEEAINELRAVLRRTPAGVVPTLLTDAEKHAAVNAAINSDENEGGEG